MNHLNALLAKEGWSLFFGVGDIASAQVAPGGKVAAPSTILALM